jgi:hypothetical protein
VFDNCLAERFPERTEVRRFHLTRRYSDCILGKVECTTAEQFFHGHPLGLRTYEKVLAVLSALGPCDVHVTRSQVTFRRRRGFAYLWLPGRWLKRPTAEVVLSIALHRRLDSARFKEIVNPSRGIWMHHLELHGEQEMDAEVEGWLETAYAEAG